MSQRRPTEAEVDLYAQDFAISGDQVRAWRIAFPESSAKAEAQHTASSLMSKMPKVCNRIRELRMIASEKADTTFGVTVESLIAELEEARQMGKANAQTSGCVAATMGKAKLTGYDVQKIDVTSKGEKLKTFGDFYV